MAPMAGPPQAVLTDVGGVLTTSVIDGIRAFSVEVSGDPRLVGRLLGRDPAGARLLVEHECGRLGTAGFEEGLAALLRSHGVDVAPEGLVDRMLATLRPDEAMVDAVTGLRARGVPVAIVSNSLGDDGYRSFDLAALADAVVISGQVGVRKPSRRAYAIACERLGVDPSTCVMIDDLEHNLAGAAKLGIRGLHHVDSHRTIATLEEWFG